MGSLLLLALLAGCDCSNFLYGGGEIEVDLLSKGGLTSGSWVVPGFTRAHLDEFGPTGGVAQNVSAEGEPVGQVLWVKTGGKNHWVLDAWIELGEAPVAVDDCEGRARFLHIGLSVDSAELNFIPGIPGPDPTVFDTADPDYDPATTPPTLALSSLVVDASRKGLTGEARATVRATSTAAGCAESDLGEAKLSVTWAFDEDQELKTGTCEGPPFEGGLGP